MKETTEKIIAEQNKRNEIRSTMKKFLKLWKQRDFKGMVKLCQLTWTSTTDAEQRLIQYLGNYRLNNHTDINISFVNDAAVCAAVHFEADIYDATVRMTQHMKLCARVICESKPYQPSETGQWGINPESLFHSIIKN